MIKMIIRVVVIGAIVIGIYSIASKDNKVKNDNVVVTPSTEQKPAGKKIAFSEFVKQNGSYKCSVDQTTGDFESKGTVYIKNGDMSGEFSTIAEGRDVKSYIIMKDGYMYTWSSASPQFGAKMAVKTDNSINTSGTYSWDPQQIGDYNCSDWTVDESKFTIPATIKFQLVGQ